MMRFGTSEAKHFLALNRIVFCVDVKHANPLANASVPKPEAYCSDPRKYVCEVTACSGQVPI